MSQPTKTSSSSSSALTILTRLHKLTSTLPGLDASLMLLQYSSPMIITLLLSLAKFRATHPHLSFSLRGKGSPITPGGAELVRLAEGYSKAAGSIGDARVIMRAFGSLPVLAGLLRVYPNPLETVLGVLTGRVIPSLKSPKAIPTMQLMALLSYYPLEHLSWLGSKGVVPLTPGTIGKATLWSVRFWAMYVLLEIYKLRQTYFGLLSRTKAFKASKPVVTAKEAEGYELPSSEGGSTEAEVSKLEECKKLKRDWLVWRDSAMVNTGYAPLTVHWSTGGNLWSSPLVTSGFGTVAAIGQLMTEWRKGEPTA